MDALYSAGIDNKLYRLWFQLNKNTKIKVRTALGDTEYRTVGELIGQGSGGAGLVSGSNLDQGVTKYFSNSEDEVAYGMVLLKPLLFQDDVLRMTTTVSGARNGNKRMDMLAKTKALELHPDKTCFVVFGEGEKLRDLEEDIEKNPIYCGEFVTKRKATERYLGDRLNGDGLAESVQSTVTERSGGTKAAIFEIRSIISDLRLQWVGGLLPAYDLFEMSVLSSLL